MRKVTIEWEDISFFTEQINIEDIEEYETINVRTTGFLLKKTKTHIYIASSILDNGKIMDLYIIPIKNIKVLK